MNSTADTVLGEPAANSLTNLDQPVGIVDGFQPSDEYPGIVEQVLKLPELSAIWR